MKIGIDASRLTVAHRTGTENYAFEVTRRMLAAPGLDFVLYFNRPPTPRLLQELNPGSNVEIRCIPFPRLWTHLRLSRELMRHSPGVLFVPAHVLPAVHPRRSVVTIHDLGYRYYPQAHPPTARRYLDLSTRFSASRAARVIAVSHTTKSDLVRHYGLDPARIEVIYHGYDAARYFPVQDQQIRQEVRAHYGLGPGRFLLYVGTLQPRKNLLRLLAAFEALAVDSRLADVQLVLGGKAGWLSEGVVAEAARLQRRFPGRLLLPGYLEDRHLPALYSQATALVFPSLYEGFGMPVLEAMACGCPVICSNSSSLPEVADEAALYHHPLDTAALEDRLQQLLTGPGLAGELSRKSLMQAARFSWEKCAGQTLQTLTGLV